MDDTDANDIVNAFNKSDDLMADLCGIIETSQKVAHQTVNTLLVQRN